MGGCPKETPAAQEKPTFEKHLRRRDAIGAVEIITSGMYVYNPSPLLRSAKLKSVSNKQSRFITVRLRDNEQTLIGFIMYRTERQFCYLYEIHVRNGYHSMGYGQQMMDELVGAMKDKTLVLFVHIKNLGAQRFYRRNGFEADVSYKSAVYFRMARFSS